MTIPRCDLAAVATEGYIYALGGTTCAMGPIYNSVERAKVYPDGSLGSWQTTTPMLAPRSHIAAAQGKRYIYALGGQEDGFRLSTVEQTTISPPSITSFSPLAVRSDQSTTVTIISANILPVPALRLGDSTILTSSFVSPTTLNATIPTGLANGWYNATVTSGDGRVATLANAVRVDGPGSVVVDGLDLTINDGALFTNQIAVTLTIGSNTDTAQMQVSNDGGFAGTEWETYTSHKTWQITQYGSYVLPRVVYVRYKDLAGIMSATFQDDIILDVTPPEGTVIILSQAELQAMGFTVTLGLSATDDVSGVGQMMISNQPNFSGAIWESYATSRVWTLGSNGIVYIRYKDNAGNVSTTYSTTPTFPIPQSPSGTITDTTPTFKWTKISGATQYYLVVYEGTSTSALYTKTVLSSACGSTRCSYTPTNILSDGAYKWKVRAYVGGAWNTYSPRMSFVVTTPPAPTDVQASDGTYTNKVLVSWNTSSGATSYKVYRAARATGTKSLLGSSTGTSFNDTTATPGFTYYYWVKACNGANCSSYSTRNTGWRKLSPPTGVTASDGTYTDKVGVTWDASSGATSYEVYRASSATGTKSLLGSPTGTSFNDTTAKPGVTNYYWVKACKGTRCSSYSTRNTGWRKLSAPTNVQASDGTYTNKVQVSWNASSGATSYKVYRAASAAGRKSLVGSPTGTSFNDTTATPGVTYYYWVKACRSSRCSSYSSSNTGWRKLSPSTGVNPN